MSIFLTTHPTPGKSIIGYKIYRNITDTAVGVSAGITGEDIDIINASDNSDKLFVNLQSPALTSGTLDKLFLGLEIETAVNTGYYPFDIRVYNIDEDGSGKYIEQVSSTSSGVYISKPTSTYRNVFEIDISPAISITAGQVVGLFFDWTSITDIGAGIHLQSTTDVNYTCYVDSHSTTIDSKIYYSEFEHAAYIESENQAFSFELINDFSTPWIEVTEGYTRYTSLDSATVSSGDGASQTIDFGSETQLNMIVFSSGDEDDLWEVQIRNSTSEAWVSVYYGRPDFFGKVENSTHWLGFPYSTRYVKVIRRQTGGGTTGVEIYGPITEYDGNKFVASGNTQDYILADPEQYDTSTYWYKIVPVDINLNTGVASVPVSNRINIL